MTAKHLLTRALDQLLTETEARHDAELKALRAANTQQLNEMREAVAAETKELRRQVRSGAALANTLRNQRDLARGSAAEYKGYSSKYQRELVAARKEIRQLVLDQGIESRNGSEPRNKTGSTPGPSGGRCAP